MSDINEDDDFEYDETNIIRANDTDIPNGNRDHLRIEVVPDDERITSSVLQLEEYATARGVRARQIELGAPPYVDIDGLPDATTIAVIEIINRQSPLIVERTLSATESVIIVEHWKVREMAYLDIDFTQYTKEKIAERQWNKLFARQLES